MSVYSIKQLELVSGIKAHTIRMWERRYGLFTPLRTDTNIRKYNDTDIQLILNITQLLRNGLKISKVAKKTEEEISQLTLQLSTKLDSTKNDNLEPLILAMLTFNQTSFKSYINKKINETGLEKTYEDLILPFLYRIGILWQTGMIKPTHEHFVTNILKQTIIFQAESVKEPKVDSPIILYFLPEGEYHEIGLLFYSFIGRKMGFRTLYLGQSTPVDDVVSMAKDVNPAIIFTSSSSNFSKLNLDVLLKTLKKSIPGCHLFLTGYAANIDKINIPKEIYIVSGIDTFKNKVSTLKLK